VQPRPRADELLATVAEVLERDLVPALSGPAQHHARVAASLVGIVERELRLGPAAQAREVEVLRGLLGTTDDTATDHTATDHTASEDDVVALRTRLAAELRAGMADDPARAAEIWPALMELVRADLAISKPGHDSWEGQ
jgi:hypothetical protein